MDFPYFASMPGTQFTRTRIAPTPSGYLHVGNVLSFVITAALAERYGAKILLRIDDLDQARVNPAYVQDIFDTLNFLEIPWHEGPRDMDEYRREWSQVHRVRLYHEALDMLKDRGAVFACSCSRAQVRAASGSEIYAGTCTEKQTPLDAAGVSWRLRTRDNEILSINTLTEGLIETCLPEEMKNFVVRKKDGYPAYQLSSLTDDVYFGVDLIVRGQDLLPSTIAQLYLAQVIGSDAFTNTTFYHHQLLSNPTGEKLSKSAGDTSIQSLRKQGKTPADIYTSIAKTLGFDHRVQSREELASLIL